MVKIATAKLLIFLLVFALCTTQALAQQATAVAAQDTSLMTSLNERLERN
jgi:hypothetical protein